MSSSLKTGGLGLLVDVHIGDQEVLALAERLLRLQFERVVALAGAQVADFDKAAILRILSAAAIAATRSSGCASGPGNSVGVR